MIGLAGTETGLAPNRFWQNSHANCLLEDRDSLARNTTMPSLQVTAVFEPPIVQSVNRLTDFQQENAPTVLLETRPRRTVRTRSEPTLTVTSTIVGF